MIIRAPGLPLSPDPLIAEAKRRARRRWLVIALSVAVLAGGTAAVALRSFGPSGASGTQGVLGQSVTAALAQRSVHWNERQWADMVGSWRVSADVTPHEGVERITIPGAFWGTPDPGKVELRFVNGANYVTGNRKGLKWFLFLTDAQAASYAGRWISIPNTSWHYARVSGGLTLGSVVHAATSPDRFQGTKLTATRRTARGAPVIVLQGGERTPGYMRLSVQARGERLPVSVYAITGLAEGFRGSFSKWNEPVRVTAPTHAVPIAAVRRS